MIISVIEPAELVHMPYIADPPAPDDDDDDDDNDDDDDDDDIA